MILSQFFKGCSASALVGANHFQLCLFLLMFASRFLVLLCLLLVFFLFLVFGFTYFKLWKVRIRFAIMNPPLIAPNTPTPTPTPTHPKASAHNTHTHTHTHTPLKASPHNTHIHYRLSPQPPRMFCITIFSLIFTSYDCINSVHS